MIHLVLNLPLVDAGRSSSGVARRGCRSSTAMEASISYITLGVRDLKAATAFYSGTLELPLLPSPNDQVSLFDMGCVRLALYPRARLSTAAGLAPSSEFTGGRDDTSKPVGSESADADDADTGATASADFCLSHNVRERHQVDTLLAHVGARGGTVTRPGHATEWGGYVGYFTDPDGFLWEVAWNPGFVHT